MNLRILTLLAVLATPLATGAEPADKDFYVVLGSFSSMERADVARSRSPETLSVLHNELEDGSVTYRLVAGPFDTYEQAVDHKTQIASEGVTSAWITSEEAAQVDVPQIDEVALAETDENGEEEQGFRDVLGNETLLKRGIPQDLNRGALPRVSQAMLRRFKQKQEQPAGTLLPPVERPRSNQVSQLQQISISDIRTRGSSLLDADLSALFEPYRGTTITTEELLSLKNQANQMFVANGYINSGVVIPDQQVSDGVVYLDVIEGEVERIDVTGDFREGYIRGRLDTGTPFNLKDLQQSLKLLEKNPLIERVHARIVPGREIGIANVDISVDAAKKYRVGFLTANNRSPGIGAEYGELYFAADNLTTFGDTLRVAGAVTEGMDSHEVDFSIPFNSRDWRFVLGYTRSDSSAIEEPFDDIDIDSITESARVGVVMPVYRSPNSEFAVELYAEKRRNLTSIFGTPFSFSEGAVNGESRVSPIRLGASYVRQGIAQSFAGRLVVSKGMDYFDASDNETGPDGDFTTIMAQLQYSRQITDNFHITGKALAQYASDPLMAIERVSVGGMGTVRGYRVNQIVRDNVYMATLEGTYRLPIERFLVQLVTFVDYGSGKNDDDATNSDRDSLSSAGIGFTFRAQSGFSADVYFAHGFDDFDVLNNDLQDDGVHFHISYEYRF